MEIAELAVLELLAVVVVVEGDKPGPLAQIDRLPVWRPTDELVLQLDGKPLHGISYTLLTPRFPLNG